MFKHMFETYDFTFRVKAYQVNRQAIENRKA